MGITLVSAIPGQKIGPLPFEGFDKLVHFGFFATLSAALALGIGRRRWARQGFWMVLLEDLIFMILQRLDLLFHLKLIWVFYLKQNLQLLL